MRCISLRKDQTHLLAESTDSLIIFRILTCELIARETQDDQTLVLVLLVQFFKTFKLRSETTSVEEREIEKLGKKRGWIEGAEAEDGDKDEKRLLVARDQSEM